MKKVRTCDEIINDCGSCRFNDGFDCTNDHWKTAVDFNKPVESSEGECLFYEKGGAK